MKTGHASFGSFPARLGPGLSSVAIALLLQPRRLAAQSPVPDDFNPGADNPVLSLAVQADRKILIGGFFNKVGGETRRQIARLNAETVSGSAADAAPEITQHPQSQTILVGGTTTLTVVATGSEPFG